MNFSSLSSTDKAKNLRNSCIRKRTRECGNFMNDLGIAGMPADELYSDCAGSSTLCKKQKVNNSCRFDQKIDDIQESDCYDFFECHADRKITQLAVNAEIAHFSDDEAQVVLVENEPQSSNFEDLLFGLVSESQYTQVVSNKFDAACVVESTGKQEHRGGKCSRDSDSSSDSSDADIFNSVGWVDVRSSNAHLGRTSCLLSPCSANNGSNAGSASGILLAHSMDSKADSLQSTKKRNEGKKREKGIEDCVKLSTESDHSERKPNRHSPASSPRSQTFSNDSNQFALLRKVHRAMSPHGAKCGKMSTQQTVDSVDNCSGLNFSSIKNMSSGESGCCDMLTPYRKHKKHRKNIEVADYSEFSSTQSSCHRKKKHHEHTSTLVNKLSSSTDNLSCSSKKHVTVGRERLEYDSTFVQDKQWNVFKKQVKLTEDFVELADSPSFPRKKKRKKHQEDDKASTYAAESSSPFAPGVGSPMYTDSLEWNVSCIEYLQTADDSCTDLSEKRQNNRDTCEKVAEAVNGKDCTKCNKSSSTPHRIKSKRKVVSECSSPLTYANSIPSPCSSVIIGTVDEQKAHCAGVLLHDSFAGSINNNEDVLLEKYLPQTCNTVECENTSVQKTSDKNEFEQLLLDVLISDTPSASHAHFECTNGEDAAALSSKERRFERTLSESTSDDDTVSSVSEEANSRDNCTEHSRTISNTKAMVCCDSTADNIQTQTLHSADESQTCNFEHHRQKDNSVISVTSHRYVDHLGSSTSIIDVELNSKLKSSIEHQVFVATDVTGSQLGPDLLTRNMSLSDAVGESQSGQHTVIESATSNVDQSDASGTQLPNAQDLEQHQQLEDETDLLTQDNIDSVCSEMSDMEPDHVSEAELSEQAAELTTKSVPLSSPSLLSTNEEDKICIESSETDDESSAESDAVSSFCMKSKNFCIVYSQKIF